MMVDKEAQEKIAGIIDLAYRQDPNEPDTGSVGFVEFWANQVITELGRLGYRKLPKGKPPLLSDEKKDKLINLVTKLTNPMPLVEVMRFVDAVAQAQREADIKWYSQH